MACSVQVWLRPLDDHLCTHWWHNASHAAGKTVESVCRALHHGVHWSLPTINSDPCTNRAPVQEDCYEIVTMRREICRSFCTTRSLTEVKIVVVSVLVQPGKIFLAVRVLVVKLTRLSSWVILQHKPLPACQWETLWTCNVIPDRNLIRLS